VHGRLDYGHEDSAVAGLSRLLRVIADKAAATDIPLRDTSRGLDAGAKQAQRGICAAAQPMV
jgi:hypothetical protein